MLLLAWIYALALIAIGIIGYLATDMVSLTALIPTWFGLAAAVLALLAGKPRWRHHAMHVLMLLALVGIIGTWGGFLTALSWSGGGEVPERPTAVQAQAAMALSSMVFLLIGIGSFVRARLLRRSDTSRAR
ncbi:MAG: hypothetical protein ACOCXA_00635 [Planctomycetota bacterium]